jgi:hypothetical protein
MQSQLKQLQNQLTQIQKFITKKDFAMKSTQFRKGTINPNRLRITINPNRLTYSTFLDHGSSNVDHEPTWF